MVHKRLQLIVKSHNNMNNSRLSFKNCTSSGIFGPQLCWQSIWKHVDLTDITVLETSKIKIMGRSSQEDKAGFLAEPVCL